MLSAVIGHIDTTHFETQYSTLSAALSITLMLRHVEFCVGAMTFKIAALGKTSILS